VSVEPAARPPVRSAATSPSSRAVISLAAIISAVVNGQAIGALALALEIYDDRLPLFLRSSKRFRASSEP
jgi:hypothetical protein